MNGFLDPGKEFGSLVIMIAGGVGWLDIMKNVKPRYTMRREGFGSKGITDLINLNVALKREGGVLPILYNCGFFLCFMGHIRCHLR